MDHLHVGMDVRELSGNVDRSVRRAGGLLGGTTRTARAGRTARTGRGQRPGDRPRPRPATARLTATSPLRYVLHPLLAGSRVRRRERRAQQGRRPAACRRRHVRRRDGRAAGGAASGARSPTPTPRSTGRPASTGRPVGSWAARRRASLPLADDSAVIAEPGMVLGVRTEVVVPGRGAVELAETVLLTSSGAAPRRTRPCAWSSCTDPPNV
ncbi:hypothetical protein NKH77_08055 [Streptomyces sp. M19]